MNTFIIILIVGGILIFLIRKAKYGQDLIHQENRLKEMCDAYISNNINEHDHLNDDIILNHVQKFIINLNQYSFYPEARIKAPFFFFERLHELRFISMNELIHIKEKYQNIILNLSRAIQQR